LIRERAIDFFFLKKGWIPLLFFVILSLFLTFLSTISTIVILALFSAYAVSPLIEFLSKKIRVPKVVATSIVITTIYILIFLLLFFVLPVLFKELVTLFEEIPVHIGMAMNWVTDLGEKIGIDISYNSDTSMNMILSQITSETYVKPLTTAFKALFKHTFSAVSIIVNIIIFSVVFFTITLKISTLAKFVDDLIPVAHKENTKLWLSKFDQILSGFIRGQLTVGFILGSLYAASLSFTGFERAGSFGALIGLSCLVPYIGIAISAIIVCLLALSNGGVILFVKVLLAFAIVQLIDTIFITPNIMGKKVGISPIFVIIALFSGAEIGGFLGVLIAVPTFAILKIIAEEILEKYKASKFYNE